jgi:hypothetical protein
MDSITTGFGSSVKDRVAYSLSFAEKDLVVTHNPQSERVH